MNLYCRYRTRYCSQWSSNITICFAPGGVHNTYCWTTLVGCCLGDTASTPSQKILSPPESREVFFVIASMATVWIQKTMKTSIEYYCWIKCLNQEKLDLNIALNEWATIFIWLWEYFSNMFFRYCCCSMHTKWTYNIIVTVFMVIADVIFDVIAQCKRAFSS